MWWFGLISFIINGFLCDFSLNIAINQWKKQLNFFKSLWYSVHSFIFFILSMTSIYLYLSEYFWEAFFTFFILGVLPAIGTESAPKIIRKKNVILTYFLIINLIICGYIFFIY